MNEPRSVVLIGASYAASWPIENIAGYRVVNSGVSGQQSHEMLERFEQDVISLNSQGVIIWGFINNIFRNSMSESERTEARIIDDYLEMIEQASKRGLRVVIATEVTIRPKNSIKERAIGVLGRLLGKTSYQQRVNESVRRVNARLREIAEERELLLLDFEYLLAEEDGYRALKYSQDDGSHISDAGYSAISAYAEKTALPAFGATH